MTGVDRCWILLRGTSRVAPDNGDGSIEFLLVMFLIVLIAAIAIRLLAVILPTK
jgi:hypothetical protein